MGRAGCRASFGQAHTPPEGEIRACLEEMAASFKHRVERHTWIGRASEWRRFLCANSEQQRKLVIYSTVCPSVRVLRSADKEKPCLGAGVLWECFVFCVGPASLVGLYRSFDRTVQHLRQTTAECNTSAHSSVHHTTHRNGRTPKSTVSRLRPSRK